MWVSEKGENKFLNGWNTLRSRYLVWLFSLVDGGFDGEPFMQWVMNFCRWIVQVVLRPEQTKGFVLLKKRWVVERTFGWLMGCRRLVSRRWVITRNIRDVYLPCHDPDHGEAICIKFYSSKLFKHPLRTNGKKSAFLPPLINLKHLLAKGLSTTASLFSPVMVAYQWVDKASNILNKKIALDAAGVKQTYQELLT